MRLGSLFTGAGGLDLAAEAVYGATPAWLVEYDAAPSRVLAQRFPGVPNYGDVTTINWEDEALMAPPRNDALAIRMYDMYCQGSSIEQVAQAFGRSRQSVWKMWNRRGYLMRPVRGPSRDSTEYNGVSYSVGTQGYYRSTTGDRHLLHRRVWEDANGAIPEGHDVHHVDHNKLNNDLGNLRLLTKAEHTRLHAEGVVPLDSPAIDVLTAGYP